MMIELLSTAVWDVDSSFMKEDMEMYALKGQCEHNRDDKGCSDPSISFRRIIGLNKE